MKEYQDREEVVVPSNKELFLRWKEVTYALCFEGAGIVQNDVLITRETLSVWEELFQKNLNKLSSVFIETKEYIEKYSNMKQF